MVTAVVLLVLALVTVALPAAPAVAQQSPPLPAPTEPLEPRQAARSGYAPQGIRLGLVHLYPDAGVGRSFRDETFAHIAGANAHGWITSAEADLRAEVRAGPWAAVVRGDVAERQGPAAFVGDGWQAGTRADVTLGIGRWAVAEAGAGWQRRQEARTAPLAPGQGAEPTPVATTDARLALRSRHGTVSAAVTADVRHLTFSDVPRLGIAWLPMLSAIDNSDRDRTAATLGAELAWQPGDLSSLYLRGSVGRIDYARAEDDFLYRRDGDTAQLVAGIALGRPERWRLFVEAGPLRRSSSDPRLPPVSTLAVNGGLTLAVTPLVTSQLVVGTAIAETTRPGVTAVIARRVALEVEHEALRSLVLLSTAEATWNHYIGPDRHDASLAFGSGVRWRLGPVLRLEMMVRQEQYESDFAADSYTATEGTLRLAARF